MSIEVSTPVVNSPTSIQIAFGYTPGAGDPAVDSPVIYYGPTAGNPDGSGYANSRTGRQITQTADGYSSTFDPGVGEGQDVHFICGVNFVDGSAQLSPDASFTDSVPVIVGPPPQVSPPTADSVTVSWKSDSPGQGWVMYAPADGSSQPMMQPDDNDQSTTDHTAKLADLVGGTAYSGYYVTDLDDSDVNQVSAPFPFTTLPSVSVDPPGHVAICAAPAILPLRGLTTIIVQVRTKTGAAQAGIPVAFSKGAGKAEGDLSATQGVTGADGLCKITFTATSIPPQRKKARRAIVALVGADGGKQKRRRALVIVHK